MSQEAPDFDELFAELFAPLHRYCTRLTGDGDHAEDVAQEAFIRLVTHDVRGPLPALRVWLFKVATHLVRDHVRVADNRRRLLTLHPVTPSATPSPGAEMERAERVAHVRAALNTLSERDRTMLHPPGYAIHVSGREHSVFVTDE